MRVSIPFLFVFKVHETVPEYKKRTVAQLSTDYKEDEQFQTGFEAACVFMCRVHLYACAYPYLQRTLMHMFCYIRCQSYVCVSSIVTAQLDRDSVVAVYSEQGEECRFGTKEINKMRKEVVASSYGLE